MAVGQRNEKSAVPVTLREETVCGGAQRGGRGQIHREVLLRKEFAVVLHRK